MRDNDGRKLDHHTLEKIRIRVVRQVETGARPDDIATSLGLSRSAVFSWVAAYREGGLDALRAKPVPGRPSKLSEAQIAELYAIVVRSSPAQYQINCMLWTRAVIRDMVHRQFGVALSEVSVGRWLRRIGLSPGLAPHRATQHEPERLQRWRTEIYPQIKAMATRRRAALYFVTESILQAGGTPAAAIPHDRRPPEESGSRRADTMVSAVTPKGMARFAVLPGTPDPNSFITFSKRLLSDENHRIFLIVENDPVHRCAAVADFVRSTNDGLRLLPSC